MIRDEKILRNRQPFNIEGHVQSRVTCTPRKMHACVRPSCSRLLMLAERKILKKMKNCNERLVSVVEAVCTNVPDAISTSSTLIPAILVLPPMRVSFLPLMTYVHQCSNVDILFVSLCFQNNLLLALETLQSLCWDRLERFPSLSTAAFTSKIFIAMDMGMNLCTKFTCVIRVNPFLQNCLHNFSLRKFHSWIHEIPLCTMDCFWSLLRCGNIFVIPFGALLRSMPGAIGFSNFDIRGSCFRTRSYRRIRLCSAMSGDIQVLKQDTMCNPCVQLYR